MAVIEVRSAKAVREDLGSLGDQIAAVLNIEYALSDDALNRLGAAADAQLADIDPVAYAVWREYAMEHDGWDGEPWHVLSNMLNWLMRTAGRTGASETEAEKRLAWGDR